jgi:ATP citrate (pro-S)-lyase
MSAKAIREFHGKNIPARHLIERSKGKIQLDNKRVHISPQSPSESPVKAALSQHPWLATDKLVVKPDQLIKRRGKSGLIKLNATWEECEQWLRERRGQEVDVSCVKGVLEYFLIEPFVPHQPTDEYYLAIRSGREGDEILFHHEGGVDVGDVDSKALKILVEVDEVVSAATVHSKLLTNDAVSAERKGMLAEFIVLLHSIYVDLHFTYLEINPLVVVGDNIHVLDLAARLDQTAYFECHKGWGEVEFPPPFGRPLLEEEHYIQELDSKTGASLKLTVLNPNGRIWTMVAGGGASVVYADTLSDLGMAHEVSNYGEYSGDPTETLTFEYAKTILSLMTKGSPVEGGKVLIIGGGIANFTDVAETFKGIVKAIKHFQERLRMHKVKIYVRRGGPNYQEGLRYMQESVAAMEIPIVVCGPETHMTVICQLAIDDLKNGMKGAQNVSDREALGLPRNKSWATQLSEADTDPSDQFFQLGAQAEPPTFEEPVTVSIADGLPSEGRTLAQSKGSYSNSKPLHTLFSSETRAVVYGMHPVAVQSMLDFDHLCGRKQPSVSAIVYPFAGAHYRKFFWGSREIMISVLPSLAEVFAKNPSSKLDTVVNFASCRSVYESAKEALAIPNIKTIAIIAEGVPERRTLQLIKLAHTRLQASGGPVTIIGPATVGGIKPGCFRIGNTGGRLDNVLASKLYRSGSVAYVSRSGGLSNELNNIISRNTNGVYEGIAIGGDRYPGTTFMDHLLRFEADPGVKMMVLLGEVGGTEEYKVCEAMKSGAITKPVVAWCLGTCAKMFPTEVQFGHAGACAHSDLETADAKIRALKEAGAHVPGSFNEIASLIHKVYTELVQAGIIVPGKEPPPPKIPVDFAWARKLGLIRKPASFISTISDERGEELMYAGMPISQVFEEEIGIGGVISLLWFRKRLPQYACKFIEMVLMMTADHGPAVAGAHNTIVTARAGRDLVSSLCSGLLTVGPRFGGAVDGAAKTFSWGYDTGLSPFEFVEEMRKRKELIPGIGHKIKSIHNPDKRVTILKEFALKHFPAHPVLDYALEVEQLTTKKKANLIFNVDGCIGCCFVDLLRHCGAFAPEEAEDYLKNGFLNGLFVLGRSIGFIGHFLDQTRLQEGLYRHPTDDIFYMNTSGPDLSVVPL